MRAETFPAILSDKWSSKTTARLSHVATMVRPNSGTSLLAHPKARWPARSSPSPRRRPEPSSAPGTSWSRRRTTWCSCTMLIVRPMMARRRQSPSSARQVQSNPSPALATKSASGARAAPCCTCVPPGLWRRRRVERRFDRSEMCKTPACCSFYVVACLLHAFEINEDLSGNRCSRLVAALFICTHHTPSSAHALNLALKLTSDVKTKQQASACGSTESFQSHIQL